MPTFCRHNRLIQNCPICTREQAIEARPLVSDATPAASRAHPPSPPARAPRGSGGRGGGGRQSPAGVRVRRLARGVDDGYRSPLVAGLKSSADAERLAEELAFAAGRLSALAEAPPGLYSEVAGPGELEERSWLAFLIACLSPLDGPEPFATISAARVPWASGESPVLDGLPLGPRAAADPRVFPAYRAWAERAGGQAAAFTGEPAWSPERRFARVFERLSLPGLHRDARFDLLVTLGCTGVYALRAGELMLSGASDVAVAAKRAFGIGDPLLLERRAGALAQAAGVELQALDVALFNWCRPSEPNSSGRFTLGMGEAGVVDPATLAAARDALELA